MRYLQIDIMSGSAPTGMLTLEVTEDLRRLTGKKTRICKSIHSTVGKFAITLHGFVTSHERGGSAFRASEGSGTIVVKLCSDVAAKAGTLKRVTVGFTSSDMNHRFVDKLDVRVPGVFDFVDNSVDGLVRVTLRLEVPILERSRLAAITEVDTVDS